ncbi:MAG: hypothetical protein OXK17_08390 [Thaumarchaeota archaeon]|nr:hypothetical protein [Nitrososphaerota archaeon]
MECVVCLGPAPDSEDVCAPCHSRLFDECAGCGHQRQEHTFNAYDCCHGVLEDFPGCQCTGFREKGKEEAEGKMTMEAAAP